MFEGRLSTVIFPVCFIIFLIACGGGGGANTPPSAGPVSVTLDEDTSVTGTLLGTAGEGGSLSYRIVSMPTNGVVVLSGNQFDYSPAQDFFGTDSFTYIVNENELSSAAATVSITVEAVNDPPIGENSSYSLDEDTGITNILNITDVDNEALNVEVITSTTNGELAVNPDNSFSYVPNLNFNGGDSFVFRADDGQFNTPEITISLSIVAVNDAPTIFESEEVSVLAGTEQVYDLMGNDVDGDSLSYQINQDFQKAQVVNDYQTTGQLQIDVPYGVYGSDSIEIQANDGVLDSENKTLSLDISVAETEAELTYHRYEARAYSETLDVLAINNKLVVVGNVNGTLGDVDSEINSRHFFSIHGANNEIEKVVYFSEEDIYYQIAHLYEESGKVYMIAFYEQEVFLIGLTSEFDIDFNKKFTMPYAISRETKNFEVTHIKGVGFYLIGNDNQLTYIDFNGDVVTTKSIVNEMGFDINQWIIHDTRQVGEEIFILGSFYVCNDDPELCASGSGIGTFLLKTDKSGNAKSVERVLNVFADDSAILSNGKLVFANDEVLHLVNTDGSLDWSRTLVEGFGSRVRIDSNDHIYWWVPNANSSSAIATRVDSNNILQWQTNIELETEGSIYPLQMLVDNVGNLYISYIEQLFNETTSISDFHISHIDYSGAHQWTERSAPSKITPRTLEHVRVTSMTADNRFIAIGNDPDNFHIYSYLFIANISPKP